MSIEESVEYHRLIAQGLSEDLVYVATWIDRAYSCLVQNGMGGAEAYAQAVSSWAANSLDLEVTTPETAIAAILEQGYKAQKRFPSLDPQHPEASFLLQRRADDGKPS
jgi:hypothetical protein